MENISNISNSPMESNSHLKLVAIRAAIVAVVLGSTLTLTNQTGAIFGDAGFQMLPMFQVFLTPFIVVVFSQIFGMRTARKVLLQKTEIHHSFVRTLFSHGIPVRAVALGVAAGSINTIIVAIANLLAGQNISQLPVTLIAQALILPIIFGALSQTLSFRRITKA